MKIIMRIILSLFSILLIGLLCLVCFFAVNKSFNKQTYLFDYTFFYASGKSMFPLINEGDLLVVRKESEYYLNDVIAYKDEMTGTVTHRIIDINEGYVTKGDNNTFTDTKEIIENDVYGKVVLIIPSVAYILDFIVSHLFVILLGITVVFLLMIWGGKYVRKRSS